MSSNYYTYSYNDYVRRQNNDDELIPDIQKALNGVYTAIVCYEKLARNASLDSQRDQILEIREDEKRHFEEFSKIYANLTGSQAAPVLNKGFPSVYRPGLEFAFRDAQKTVDFYLDIAQKAQNITLKETFRRAAADEQNHAVWLSFFLQQVLEYR
ncbi:ferritin-like domain-containing protein [Jeotgalibacillus sp. S-D1]|uniref:ferritin-like domain-containing protein n=1 Tax=Jeotgalibacillus sp. S-D1 TaxID=2552189 RepID=UPI0010597EAE|nr:ferritin-like domain-containing protein [Jeotgalibacillus sp. S-D1]TDL31924.1 ferritin-like domain-containing protein [Jeotgalibacillus sp. S-D1]